MKRSSKRYPQIFLAAALSAALLLSGCGRAGAGGAEDAATGMEAGRKAEQATEPGRTVLPKHPPHPKRPGRRRKRPRSRMSKTSLPKSGRRRTARG